MLDAKKLDAAFLKIIKEHRTRNLNGWMALRDKDGFWDLVIKEYENNAKPKSTKSRFSSGYGDD